jgi:ADP-dependent NAD(P)H-hydrate dehydratase / NAD(P)H-hydrate epimerase
MIKILNTQQIRELDAYTIKHEPVASIDLMERACRTFTEWFTQQFDVRNKITIVCGTGNNGGDGLGIARLLTDWGYAVKVFVIRGGASESVDFSVNLERLKKLKTEIIELDAAPSAALLSGGDVIIDAIFGSGLSRPPQGIYAAVIDQINQCSATTVAVDIPSGLMADGPSSGSIVQAQFTVTFQVPKLSFFFPSGYAYTGEWIVADIGLNKSFVKEAVTPHYAVTEKAVIKFLRHRHKFDHKGTFGHALLISGSKGKMGAAVLAARAALRSGAGLLTVHLPQCGYSIMQTALPEAMVQVDPHEEIYSSNPAELSPYTVIGLGPGLGQHTDTAEAFQQLLEQYRKPLVIDADGLNILAAQRPCSGRKYSYPPSERIRTNSRTVEERF